MLPIKCISYPKLYTMPSTKKSPTSSQFQAFESAYNNGLISDEGRIKVWETLKGDYRFSGGSVALKYSN